LKKTLISTCFISKQCGVPIMRIIIKGINVFLHITGRILGENHSFIYTLKTSVWIGALDNSLTITRTDVQMSIDASKAMVGKSKNIILRITNWTRVNMEINAISHIALTFIMNQIRDHNSHNGLKYSQKLELSLSLPIITCLTWEIWLMIKTLWEEWNRLVFLGLLQISPFRISSLSKIKFKMKLILQYLLPQRLSNNLSKIWTLMHLNLSLQSVQ
jgi:hypothetical protein